MELCKPVLIGVLSLLLMGATPSRTKTYATQTTISSSDVTENENNIFSYLQTGVDTYAAGSISATPLATDAVTSTKILDNTITASDLNATLTFADSDFLDLSAINMSSTTEGLKLGQAASCASATAEGQVCWDTDDDAISYGSGTVAQIGQSVKVWASISTAGGTVTLNDSLNVTSVTDGGVGTYTVNFTRAFASTNNACIGTSNAPEIEFGGGGTTSRAMTTRNSSGTAIDSNQVDIICIGDQ